MNTTLYSCGENMYKSDILAFLSRPENKHRKIKPSEIVDFLLMPLRVLITKDIQDLIREGYIDVIDRIETTSRYVSLLEERNEDV